MSNRYSKRKRCSSINRMSPLLCWRELSNSLNQKDKKIYSSYSRPHSRTSHLTADQDSTLRSFLGLMDIRTVELVLILSRYSRVPRAVPRAASTPPEASIPTSRMIASFCTYLQTPKDHEHLHNRLRSRPLCAMSDRSIQPSPPGWFSRDIMGC